MDRSDSLVRYRDKRNFDKTPEPRHDAAVSATAGALQFVVQKHWASRLHYDFRLEWDGAMKSWAVPKGPSFDPADKRMAVQVEDHPMAYNRFEGQIPPKQYGAGKVIVWDKGWWVPVGDAARGFRDGKLKFELHGHKLKGHWTLVRMHGKASDKQPPWLLIKEHDSFERPAAEFSVTDEAPDSVQALDMPLDPVAPQVARAKLGTAKKDSAEAPKVALPDTLSPQLATLVDTPPQDTSDWLFELKFDGYRLMARVERGRARLFTRNGHDWTDRMPQLAKALAGLPITSGWLDGEVLMLDDDGVPDFQALQNAFDGDTTGDLVYTLFDLPFANGRDLRSLPLVERRELLRGIVGAKQTGPLRFSEAFEAAPADLVASACRLGFEGVIGKRRDGHYASRRSPDWIKLKCSQRQEFVIGGYTDPKGSRTGIGSLLLGVHDGTGKKGGPLRYCGNVGTGFSERTLTQLHEKLNALARTDSPFNGPTGTGRSTHWVDPALLAEVSFAEWTKEGRVRHSVFHGLRDDKPPRRIVREKPQPVATGKTQKKATALPATLRVSHGERVIDTRTGLTKLDLVRYCATVAPLMMEHLKGRPTSLVRAPEGVGGELFFQKHLDKVQMDGVAPLDKALDSGHPPLLEIVAPNGLLSAGQMNVLEFHTWNARKDRIEQPDRMTFDLDPGEGVAWPQVQEAAHLVKVLLDELGLPAFLKTSGGKGLHVVVPIQRRHGWDAVKGFSQRVVQHLAATIPDRFVAKSGPRNRVGKIFVDYLRNGRGATTVAAWSARARPGMGISVPVTWADLPQLTGGAHWTVQSVDDRLREGNAPWAGYARAAVSLTAAMRLLPG